MLLEKKNVSPCYKSYYVTVEDYKYNDIYELRALSTTKNAIHPC